MSKSTEGSSNIFAECKKNAEKIFYEIEKSSPLYHQVSTDIQNNHFESWKKVINSSIEVQQEYASKSNMNINMSEEIVKEIRNISEQAITAVQNQNKLTLDSLESSKKIFDTFNENTKTLASLNKNIAELIESTMEKYKPSQV